MQLAQIKIRIQILFFGKNSHKCKLCPNQDLGYISYFLVTDLDPILRLKSHNITVNSVFHTMGQRIQLTKGIVC
jgi:hypothetical protein